MAKREVIMRTVTPGQLPENTSTIAPAKAARKAWKGFGWLQAALRQYREKHPELGELARLEEVLKERPMCEACPNSFASGKFDIIQLDGSLFNMQLCAMCALDSREDGTLYQKEAR